LADDATRSVSRVATWSRWLGLLSLGFAGFCVLGIHVRLLSPFLGFRLFQLGVLGGLVALVLGVVAIVRTRGGRDAAGQKSARVAAACGGALVLFVLVGALQGRGAPVINDVTTDVEHPPAFGPAAREPDNAGPDKGFPPEFAAIVRERYPELRPVELSLPPRAAFERSLTAAEALGWEVTWSDPEAGAFEAREVSPIFRFVDDVRVRVRASGTGSVVDLRSKSRVGRGDLGANAARIRAFAERLRPHAQGDNH
jgi:uncharacterized protein (DUF1499 family)